MLEFEIIIVHGSKDNAILTNVLIEIVVPQSILRAFNRLAFILFLMNTERE